MFKCRFFEVEGYYRRGGFHLADDSNPSAAFFELILEACRSGR